jgi:hypothetical protein
MYAPTLMKSVVTLGRIRWSCRGRGENVLRGSTARMTAAMVRRAPQREAHTATRCLLPTLRRLGIIGVSMLLTVTTANAAAPSPTSRPPQTFAGAPMDRQRAAGLARTGGFELIDFHPCVGSPEGCVLLAVRQPDGKVLALQVSDRRCIQVDASCLGGFTVSQQLGGRGGKPSSPAAAAKVLGKPGEGGAPPDPQHEAQAEATNEIIEALGGGKYEGNYDQFWADLESIQTWTNPAWIEPDPPPPVEDKVSMTGRFGNVNPAVLISGRYKTSEGRKECRWWVSYTSSTATISNIGNWIGNAIWDSCDSEVAVFSENGAAELVKPESRWSNGTDSLDFSVGAPINVPTTVWVIYADTDYADEKAEIEGEFALANSILAGSRCGIELGPVVYYDRTAALADPGQDLGCASIESTFKPRVGYHPNKMNVYIVKALIADERAGVACTAESDNVIVLDQGRSDTVLVHEYGHWFDLGHTTTKGMPLVNPRNIMAVTGTVPRDMLTAGQCYRANFSKDSYLNKQGLRDGKQKHCKHLQDADNECPGLKNEF